MAIDDEAELAASGLELRRQGFGARALIHPRQIAATQLAFSPSEQELAFAQNVIEALDNSEAGAIVVDGRLVDLAVVRNAQRLLSQA